MCVNVNNERANRSEDRFDIAVDTKQTRIPTLGSHFASIFSHFYWSLYLPDQNVTDSSSISRLLSMILNAIRETYFIMNRNIEMLERDNLIRCCVIAPPVVLSSLDALEVAVDEAAITKVSPLSRASQTLYRFLNETRTIQEGKSCCVTT